jgi:protein O-mannosyl-transferase
MHSAMPTTRARNVSVAAWPWCTPDRAAVWFPALVAVICYLPALRNGFALDDRIIIADDGPLHALGTLAGALGRAYWYDAGHLYRPLTTLAFGLEWAVGRGSPLVFHAVNLMWHAVVASLVARLALRWWPPVAAGAAGLWFAVHPVHAEAVANIVGRSELVCGAALIGLALLAAPPPRPRGGTGATEGSSPRVVTRLTLWLAFGLAASAMASKETGVVAPAIAWAAAVTPLHGDARSNAQRRADAWRLTRAAAAGVVCLLAARWLVLGTLAGDDPHYAFTLATGWRGTALALATVPRAVALVLVPQWPRLDYSPPDSDILHPNAALVCVGALLVVAGAAAVAAHVRRPARWSFAACLAACTYAPVSNLMVRTGVVLADRTLYAPSVAVALAVGAAIGAACTGATAPRRRLVMAGAGALAAIGGAIGAAIAVRASAVWRDTPTAFAAIRDRSPTSYVGHFMCAEAKDATGDPRGARAEYAAAIALTPHHAPLLYMAAANALRLHDTAAARMLLARAVALRPDPPRPRTALIALDLEHGDTVAARQLLRDGLARDSTQRQWRSELQGLSIPSPSPSPTGVAVRPASR